MRCTAISQRSFSKSGGDITPLVIRLTGILMSLVAGIVGYFLVCKVRNKNVGLLYLLIYVCVPYFTQAGRVALDCNLMLGMTVVMLYILHECIKVRNDDRMHLFFFLGVVTGMTFYTYALSYIIIPLFYVGIFLILIICNRRLNLKAIALFAIPVLILAFPLILVQIVNIYDIPEIKLFNLTITKLLYYRGSEISLHEIKDNIAWIYRSIFTADNTEFDSFPQFGTLYFFSMPFIILGGSITLVRFIKGLKKKVIIYDGIILMYVAVVLISALFIRGVTTYRINSVFFGLVFLIVIAIEYLISSESFDVTNRVIYNISCVFGYGAIVCYIVFALVFYRYYFCEYKDAIYPQRLFAENPTEAFEYIAALDEDHVRRLTYVGGVDEAYVYWLLSQKISPYEYDVNKYGNNGDGVRYTFYTRAPYDKECNYIMYNPDNESREELISVGHEEHDFGAYKVYIAPQN